MQTITKTQMLEAHIPPIAICDLPDDWSGSALDVLRSNKISNHCKFQIISNFNLIQNYQGMEFAIWCSQRVQGQMIDERSIRAVETAEKFINGDASSEELYDARTDAIKVSEYIGAIPKSDNDAKSRAVWAAAECAAISVAEHYTNRVEEVSFLAISALRLNEPFQDRSETERKELAAHIEKLIDIVASRTH